MSRSMAWHPQRRSQHAPPPGERNADEDDDDLVVLGRDYVEFAQFRQKISELKTDQDKYALCLQIRDKLLREYTEVCLQANAYEIVMNIHCAEYRGWKRARNKASAEGDTVEWERFLLIAQSGQKLRSRCLSALKWVAHHWGQEVVQHYQWASKGRKYCDKLCTAARAVPEWKKAVTGLNLLMLRRCQLGPSLKRRPICASFNPIEQGDLDNLAKHPLGDGRVDVPEGFGFDKFGLLVSKEFALPQADRASSRNPPTSSEADHSDTSANLSAPTCTVSADLRQAGASEELDQTSSDLMDGSVNSFLAEIHDGPPTRHDQHSTESTAVWHSPDRTDDTHTIAAEAAGRTASNTNGVVAEDSPSPPNPDLSIASEEFDQPHSNTNGTVAEDCPNRADAGSNIFTGMTLRRRRELSYRVPAGTSAKLKRPRSTLVKTPEITQLCCPKVPRPLLSTLENSTLNRVVAEQLSHFLKELCRDHLELWGKRTLDLVFTQKTSIEVSSEALLHNGANLLPRRRAGSLPDITQPKRPRLSTPPPCSPACIRTTTPGGRPVCDHTVDETYRRQVLVELSQATLPPGSHGAETNQLVRELLSKVEHPKSSSCGPVEAWFCTGNEAARLVESSSPVGVPIITQDEQPFRWGENGRPIEQFFRRMYNIDQSVSVQIPSRRSTEQSFKVRELREVRDRFLDQKNTNDPWNILDLQSPVQSTLPNFLTGENSELLLHVRNTVLMQGSAERVTASPQRWNELKDVREWALLSQGSHHTAPHMDSHGYATWITAQEGSIGFGWMSCPTEGERQAWMAEPHRYTGGRWRYIILKPGQTIFFGPGTIHFVFRVRDCQTLAFGGHVLQWSDIQCWIQVVLAELKYPAITNEEMKRTAPKLVAVVAKLVEAKRKTAGVEPLGGEDAVTGFFASLKELEEMYSTRRPGRRLTGR